MTRAKVSQYPVEVLFSATATKAKVAQLPVEVVVSAAALPSLGGASSAGIGTYGDEANGGSLDGAWTLRNIAGVTATGTGYSTLFDAQGDAIYRSYTDTAGDFNIAVHLTGLTDAGGMIGLFAADNNGTGVAFSRYNDGNTYIWNLLTYNYSSTGPSVGSSPTIGDHWLELRRTGTTWSGRYSNNGSTWSSFATGYTDGRTITRIGVVRAYVNGGNQTVLIERFMAPTDVTGFTGGAMVAQDVTEVVATVSGPSTRVTQHSVEVLVSDTTTSTSGTGERSYTYVA